MIAEIQVLPEPMGTPEDHFAHVDAAIAVIQASGLTYEVGALGTTVEGSTRDVWNLLQQVHEATLRAGAGATVTVIKVVELAEGREQPTIAGLTGKFREDDG